MKKILYILIVSVLFQINVSYAMQQNVITQQTSYTYKDIAFSIIIGMMLPVLAFNFGFYSETIKKKLNKILFGSSGLTPQKLAKKASALAKDSANTSADVAKYDIYQACKHGAIERVKELLKDPNLDINKPRSYQRACETITEIPLHIACKEQHSEIVELLLSRPGIQVNQEDNYGNTPLILAYFYGRQYKQIACDWAPILLGVNLKTVQKLLDNPRVDINHKNKRDESILSLACKDNTTTLVKQLLQDSRIQFDNNLPLCYACKNENVEIVQLLLERNVNNCMNINECRARLIENPLLIICSHIRKYDKELKQETRYNAWQSSASNMMDFLLGETTSQKIQKIKINRARCKEIFNLLLNDPAISIDTPETCMTALHLCTSDHTLLSQLLSRTTPSINKLALNSHLFDSYSGENYTPLHMAMMEGSLESILLLIQHGADITIKNNKGELPLKLLCSYTSTNAGNILIFKTLLEQKIITQKDLDENHCLVKLIAGARNSADNEIPKLLLEYGANPNQYHDDKWVSSPLFAAAYNNLSLLNLCLDRYNGNYKQKNPRGETILYTAFMRKIVKHIHHVNFLKKLDLQKRKEYMLYELTAATEYDPRSIKQTYLSFENYSSEELKKDMDLFSLFLNKCICFGKINLISPISNPLQLGSTAENNEAGANKSLLDLAHENMKKIQTSQDDDDKKKHLYSEIILHTFMQQVKPAQYCQLSDELKVHYQLVQTYKTNHYDYYYYIILNKKEEQQRYLRGQIKLEVHNNTGNETGSLRAITCSIF